MSEKVRHVAVATCTNVLERGVCQCVGGGEMLDWCRDRGRAAIAAMREPTEAMIEAVAADYFPRALPENRYAVISDCWRAMIDAALK